MKTVYLVRHCSATGQLPEAELSQAGHQQAKELASFFSEKIIHHIISSPYIRAVDSIQPTAQSKNIPIMIDERLTERVLSSSNLPNWLELLEQTFTDLDLKLDGGESSREATDRAIKVVNESPNNGVLVTHGNLLSLILKHFDNSIDFHDWQSLSNPDVFTLTIVNHESTIEHLWKN
ncbi:histidine phosphatase family protein [Paenisporosarcina macmurdoensis]|uniref:Histidine phosphatase family protein n=1 Tax=Paenisporosarcina macmurdoensis TaxID=212659 RepID=A0ABW1LCS5_9BACL